MINRIFIIPEFVSSPPGSPSDPDLFSGSLLLPGESIYFSITANPQVEGSLDQAYDRMGQRMATGKAPDQALALTINDLPDAGVVRAVTSFLFIPGYLHIGHRPVLILTGADGGLLSDAAAAFTGYFAAQGIRDPVVHTLLSGPAPRRDTRLFHSQAGLQEGYRELLQTERYYNNDLFFYLPSPEDLPEALSSLRQAEADLRQQAPRLFSAAIVNSQLENELGCLRRLQASTLTELDHQRQYVTILRSEHATKELQDYYTREYEILPLWYKRFGHILKVLTGKRTFRSLFRDNVKKYKD
jgi:hypothetical protein